jgi:hypothetical protein
MASVNGPGRYLSGSNGIFMFAGIIDPERLKHRQKPRPGGLKFCGHGAL